MFIVVLQTSLGFSADEVALSNQQEGAAVNAKVATSPTQNSLASKIEYLDMKNFASYVREAVEIYLSGEVNSTYKVNLIQVSESLKSRKEEIVTRILTEVKIARISKEGFSELAKNNSVFPRAFFYKAISGTEVGISTGLYLSQELNLNKTWDLSIVVHELVHAIQAVINADSEATIDGRCKDEPEAFFVQDIWLSKKLEPSASRRGIVQTALHFISSCIRVGK